MPPLFHPWLREARLAALRGGGWKRGRGAVAALALALVGALGMRAAGGEAAALPAALPRLVAQSPLPFALLALALSYASARARLSALDDTLRHGWWAAAPVEPARATRTLILLAALGGAAAVFVVAAMLIAFGGDGERLRTAFFVVAAGLVPGTALGLIAALRQRRRPVQRLREGAREPLFGLRWLDDARLPHLSDWQRREALLRWRRGGHAWMIGAVLLALPGSTALTSGAGVLLIAIALAWFSLLAQACAAASVAAARALAAAPSSRRGFVRAAWRYPAFAFVCACAMAGAGAVLLGLSWRAAPALFGIALLMCLPALTALRGERRS
ncbi:hypothetical protein J5226_02980 [Lysobacter sp. K5869]|uniref:hypothetical protein n=1 Tax=Lysobacter sp. K5869 TaxID=2820808 RepID=UPI001C05F235|nr:hypothetical protein [Lysobacter sp. K5869]QWP77386.1 hypothetical protein J5226_02980 [Lysobacter sp. K5869]